MVSTALKLEKTFAPLKKSHNNPRQYFKKQTHLFADKDPYR